MSNPLYKQYGNQPLYEGGIPQLLEDAKQLKQKITNPKAEVERLMQTGQLSQAKFNELNQIASSIMSAIK